MHATAVLVGVLAGACRTLPGPVRNHPIRAHFLPSCTPASTTPFRLDLSAEGDFDPTGVTFESFDDPGVSGRALVVPPTTEAVVLDGTSGATPLLGLGTKGADSAVDVSLWPARAGCVLAGDEASGYPTGGAGEALGATTDGRYVLVAGGSGRGAASALEVDLSTGKTTDVTGADGPRAARVSAVITPFGDGLLVSGGEAPDTGEALGSADVFDAPGGRFEPERIELERPRARHGAVVLDGGETLLAGGVDSAGRAIRRLEIVSPATRTYRIAGLAELAFGRLDPVVLHLTDGRILVAGGTDPDSPGTPVDTLEWLTPDATNPDGTLTLDPPTARRAFVAMPGGSVLVAGGCVTTASGCTPSGQVLWITRDGVSTELSPLDFPSDRPVLVPGRDGRPLLVADGGAPDPDAARLLRVFDPFLGAFVDDDSLPDAPAIAASGDGESGSPRARFVAPDHGLLVWLDTKGVLSGARYGTRNPWSADVSTLVSEDLSGVSLDRAPASNWDETSRTVRLGGGARLSLTDTTYADVHVAVGVSGAAFPVVHLGPNAYGDRACPFPEGSGSTVSIDRRGASVRLSRGDATRECAGPDGRVSVWLEGGGTLPIVASVAVRRTPQ
ncbi:MAG TPA: hypothetical protein VHE30_00740 [Polyangiaceae bacterium]|nr:hypothetical protein [Polyangiaceae bacterium]